MLIYFYTIVVADVAFTLESYTVTEAAGMIEIARVVLIVNENATLDRNVTFTVNRNDMFGANKLLADPLLGTRIVLYNSFTYTFYKELSNLNLI